MSSPAAVISARRATSDIVIQIVAQVANLGLGLLVTALIARQLGTVGFGEWSTIFAVTLVTGYLADLKLAEVTIREIAADRGREREWLGALLSLRAALGVPVALIAAELDQVSTPAAMSALAGRLPRASLVILPVAAHMSPFTDPAALARLIRCGRPA